jgi:methyl-accepting chemotaxis protein
VRKKSTGIGVQEPMRNRGLIFSISIFIVLAGAMAAFGQTTQADANLTESDKAAIRDVQNIAGLAARLLAVYMDARVTEMLTCCAIGDRFRDALTAPEARAGANQALKSWLNTVGAYEALLLVDKSGACVAAAPEELANRNFSGDEAFKGAIAVPIKGANDVEGVLMSFLQWSKVTDLLQGVQIGQTGYAYLLNRQRQLIGHPQEDWYGVSPRDLGAPAVDEAVMKKLPSTSYEFRNPMTGAMDTKVAGFAYPKGYGNFPGLGWTVGAGVDRSETAGGQSAWNMFFRFLEGLLKSQGKK